MKVQSIQYGTVAMTLCLASTAFAGSGDDAPYFGKFTSNPMSLTASIKVDAPCSASWAVLTELDKLRSLAPHLNLSTENNKKVADKRGDFVYFKVKKSDHMATGKFILTSPVPHQSIQAIVVPDRGPWMRVQTWELVKDGPKACTVQYNEAYNEHWVRAAGIYGSKFVPKNRDHHMHVVLRRIKFMAEGKDPGPADETTYLFADARDFPNMFRKKQK